MNIDQFSFTGKKKGGVQILVTAKINMVNPMMQDKYVLGNWIIVVFFI